MSSRHSGMAQAPVRRQLVRISHTLRIGHCDGMDYTGAQGML
jgi:hypothetical protein